jgi:hypothetical protein
MDKSLIDLVRNRAGNRCEYCLVGQRHSKLTFPIDHIIARQHGGETTSQNLALCCGRCNCRKGPNISGIDPQTQKMCRLFNPRVDGWHAHFRYEEAVLVGITDVGRTTVAVLGINEAVRIAVRKSLLDAGGIS